MCMPCIRDNRGWQRFECDDVNARTVYVVQHMEAMMSGNEEDLQPLYEKPPFEEEAFDQAEPWWRFEFPDKLDGVLRTMATLLSVDRPDRHDQQVAVCEILSMLGLTVRTT